jgi:hypothetical protein
MDTSMWMWLTGIAGIIAALGAVGAAGAATWLLIYARRQAQEMLEARYAQSRPLVIPLSAPPLLGAADGIREDFYPHAPPDRPGFRNIGTGPALNAWAVIFGPRPTVPSEILPERRTVFMEVPIRPGEERATRMVQSDAQPSIWMGIPSTRCTPLQSQPREMSCCATPCAFWHGTRAPTATSLVAGT